MVCKDYTRSLLCRRSLATDCTLHAGLGTKTSAGGRWAARLGRSHWTGSRSYYRYALQYPHSSFRLNIILYPMVSLAYRIATQGSDLVAVKPSAREIYHHLNPHPGLSPVPNVSTPSRSSEQQNNENLYRHLLAQGVLAVLLPTEDLENVCLRTLVEDVLSDLILGNQVSGRICEGWFIWTAISKVITMAKQRDSVTTVTVGQSLDAVADLNRLERFGLLSEDGNEDRNAQKHRRSTASLWLWKILYSVYLTYVTMRFVIGGLLHTALSNPVVKTTEMLQAAPVATTKATNQPSLCRPVLSYRVFSLISQSLGVPQRMPWLNGSLSLIQSLFLAGPGKIGETGSVLDR